LGQKIYRRRRFSGGNVTLFWATKGHFLYAAGFFFGFLINYRAFLRHLGEVDSAHDNFLAPKQTKKNERIQTKKSRALRSFVFLFWIQCTQSRTSMETRALPTRYDSTYSAQRRFEDETRCPEGQLGAATLAPHEPGRRGPGLYTTRQTGCYNRPSQGVPPSTKTKYAYM
jgi:hypothetical protein